MYKRYFILYFNWFAQKILLHKAIAINRYASATKACVKPHQKQKLALSFTKSRHLPFPCSALKRTPCIPQVNLVPFASRVCIGCFYRAHLSLLQRISSCINALILGERKCGITDDFVTVQKDSQWNWMMLWLLLYKDHLTITAFVSVEHKGI